jgi:DNA primase
VTDSDAIIVVEGRSDVLTLLEYGIKNAIGVEGTDVPDAVSDLTEERTVTAFLDGDRGGELILRELAQVGDVDYVVFAPEGRSVEDLDHHEVMSALRDKTPYAEFEEDADLPTHGGPPAAVDADGSSRPPESTPTTSVPVGDGSAEPEPGPAPDAGADAPGVDERSEDEVDDAEADADAEADDTDGDDATDTATTDDALTLREHVRAAIEGETGTARLLDDDFHLSRTVPAAEAFDAVSDAEATPYAVVLDGMVTQRLLDVAAQRGVEHVVARSADEMVKTPVDVRVRTVDQLAAVD